MAKVLEKKRKNLDHLVLRKFIPFLDDNKTQRFLNIFFYRGTGYLVSMIFIKQTVRKITYVATS